MAILQEQRGVGILVTTLLLYVVLALVILAGWVLFKVTFLVHTRESPSIDRVFLLLQWSD